MSWCSRITQIIRVVSAAIMEGFYKSVKWISYIEKMGKQDVSPRELAEGLEVVLRFSEGGVLIMRRKLSSVAGSLGM